MEPLTTIAVALGIKAGGNMIDAFTSWLGGGRYDQSMHLSPSGGPSLYSGALQPDLYYTPLVQVEIEFETSTPELTEYIDGGSPSLLVVATPDPSGEPVVDVMPCVLTDRFVVALPAGEISVGILVFHDELVDEDGDPLLVAWQIVETEVYDHMLLPIDVQFDPDFISLLQLSQGVPVCDECWLEDDIVTSAWRVTGKGNLKCIVCGTNNDFHECVRCESELFRPTRKGNYRCLNCDKKVVA